MTQQEAVQSPGRSGDQFARVVRESVATGAIAGAVAAVTTKQMMRIEAFGFQNQALSTPMELQTIFRMASTAKMVFTVAALVLLQEKKFRLEEEISKWVPELGNRRVLRTPGSELDDTVPARREITMFDVLTFQLGIGMYLAPQVTPLLRAMMALGVAPATESVPFGPDEFMSRLGSLPLAHQPGETFMYHTGDDVLRVLISRIAGQSLGEFLRERVFDPLRMIDSALSVPNSKLARFSTCYLPQKDAGNKLSVWDEADGRFAKDPLYPNQIVSTVSDYINLTNMLLCEGSFQGRRVLAPQSVVLMMTDHLNAEQKARSPAPRAFWEVRGWGMGATVYTQSIPRGPGARSYSWFGGFGPHFIVDKKRGSSIILMIPRVVQGDKETELGYEYELNTYRDILS